jgi:hypothetical protein
MYFSWKSALAGKHWDIGELDQSNRDLICAQLARENAFANKSADFSVCQLAVQ